MFGKSNNEGKQIFFRQPFSERYTLTVKADILAGSIPIKTVTEIRWDVRVKKVMNEESAIEVLTLDSNLLETNNSALKDLARMNQAFARMYSELDLIIDRKGIVKQIQNIDLLKKKWTNTKAEMQAIDEQSDALKGIVIVNDELFTTPPKMVQAIQNSEFFNIYFQYLYGIALPAKTKTVSKWNHFQKAEVQWQYDINPAVPLPTDDSYIDINITGNTITQLNKEWIKKAYGAFQNIDLLQITPRLSELGKYTIEPASGKLLNAYLLKEEVAHPQLLYSRLEYFLKSDSAETDAEKTIFKGRSQTTRPTF